MKSTLNIAIDCLLTTAVVASVPTYPYADTKSFTFTMALGTDQARLFVHWALIHQDGTIRYHTHRLEEYSFHKLDDTVQIHHDMDNVLDWVVGTMRRKTGAAVERIQKAKKVVDHPSPPKKQKI